MEIIEKQNRIIVKREPNKNIVIPSKLYPLESEKFSLFTPDNTNEIVDKKIQNIFDSIVQERGRCFTNSYILLDKLKKNGYDAEQYVGWLFLDDMEPIHHSFIVLNENVLDLSLDLSIEMMNAIYQKYEINSKDDYRKALVKELKEKEKLKNHERFVFGKCKENTFYIAAPGTKEQGIKRNLELRNIFPEHPSFQDVNKNGSTKTLDMYYGGK